MSHGFDLPPDFQDCIGIFQGGGCRAAAYAGAVSAAVERGVNFDEVAGASAGSIAAVLVAAGATPLQLEEILSDLDFSSMLKKPKGKYFAASGKNLPGKLYNLIRFNGIYDGSEIERWIESQLRNLLPGINHPKIRFRDLRKPASVIAADLETHRPIVWSTSTTPDFPVAEAVRSSCTIPFFFQPNGPYVDGGVLANLPLHIVESDPSDLRRVVAFTLVDADPSDRPKDILGTAAALFSTVTEGGKTVQRSLQGFVDEIPIRCGSIKATDFASMDDTKVRSLIAAGRSAVEEFFGAGAVATSPLRPQQVSRHKAQTLTSAVDHLLGAKKSVVLSLIIGDRGHNWYFDLFAAILLARVRGVDVYVLSEDFASSPDSEQQVMTLKAMGCSIMVLDPGVKLPLQAIICDAGEHGESAILLQRTAELDIHARLFSGIDGDSALIALIRDAIVDPEAKPSAAESISFRKADFQDVVTALRPVKQYGESVAITLEQVPLDDIDSWAHYAHIYKQRQQTEIGVVLRDRNIEAFEPYLVVYGNGTESLAMPIVVEKRPDGRYTVVNGLSRLLILKREGAASALCAVVSGVVAPPPAVDPKPLSYLGVRVGVREDTKHRYPGFAYQNVRSVERFAHSLRVTGPQEPTDDDNDA